MRSDGSNEQRDKIAAYCFGTPALMGVIAITVTLGVPGSVPARNAATMIPIGIGLVLLGTIGGIAYWARSRRNGARGGPASVASTEARRRPARQLKHSVTFTPAATDKIRRIFV